MVYQSFALLRMKFGSIPALSIVNNHPKNIKKRVETTPSLLVKHIDLIAHEL